MFNLSLILIRTLKSFVNTGPGVQLNKTISHPRKLYPQTNVNVHSVGCSKLKKIKIHKT